MTRLFERYRVIDTDTHITEPPDVWTSRLPRNWADLAPRVERREGKDWWIVAGQPAGAPGAYTAAGFDGSAWVREIERCAKLGHRAVLACGQPQVWGQPRLCDRHWDPAWAAAQDHALSISFHIGSGDMTELFRDDAKIGMRSNFPRVSSLYFIDNSRCLADVIFGGVCHRFPRLKLVSVESGVGWIPPTLESFDWQWRNGGIWKDHPEYALLPSEYFRRQLYGCFWFEEGSVQDAIRRYPDNFLYETDFPHPTCMHPGPQTSAQHPRDYAERALAGLPDALLAKVLHDNAAALYRLD